MRFLLALFGIGLLVFAGLMGLFEGEIRRIQSTPEWKADQDRRKKERDRQQAWKDQWKDKGE